MNSSFPFLPRLRKTPAPTAASAMRMVAFVTALATLSAFAQPAVDLPRASPRASVSQSIGYTKVTVDYCRPGVKGRVIWGGLVPYGKVWRAGANEATTVEFSTDAKINGQPLPKGIYAFFILPGEKEWTLIFNKAYKSWGAFTYDQKDDVLRVKATPRPAEFRERVEYGFEDLTDSSASLYVRWDKLQASLGIVVEFLETAKANIRAGLAKAKPDDQNAYLNSARFYWNYDIDRKQAMAWVDKSIQIKPVQANLWAKAEWLAAEKKNGEAMRFAELARAEAEKDPNPKPLLEAMDKAMSKWPAPANR